MVKTPKHERPEWLKEPPTDSQREAARTRVGTFLDCRKAKGLPTKDPKAMLPEFLDFMSKQR